MDFNITNLPGEYASIVTSFTMIVFIFWILIHIIFAVAVFKDASKRETNLVGPFLWSLVTLFGGVFFAGVYWVVNRLTVSENLAQLAGSENGGGNSVDVENRLDKFKSNYTNRSR